MIKNNTWVKLVSSRFAGVCVGLCLLGTTDASALVTNSWVGVSGSGYWESPFQWSLYMQPSLFVDCLAINNAGTKTVQIVGAGPGPCSTVQNVLLAAPAGYTNTLQVDAFEAPNMLTVTNLLEVDSGGVFALNNSSASMRAANANSGKIRVSSGTLSVSGSLLVGGDLYGSQLTVENGGQLRVASNSFEYVYQGFKYVNEEFNSVIGWYGNSSNNTVTVTGAGSVWSNAFGIEVGYFGYNNQLMIGNGGRVLCGSGVGVSGGAGGTPSGNRILVDGANSLLSAKTLSVGVLGVSMYSQIAVSNSARVVTERGAIGDGNAYYNSGIVAGAGSVWSNADRLVVGFYGPGNRLTIADGGRVVNGNESYVGHNKDSHESGVLVTGTGSTWNFGTNLYVGFGGSDSELAVTNGGTVAGQHGFLGYNTTAIGNSATVSGAGSVWSNGAELVVGYKGSNNVLTVANQALVSAPELTAGSEENTRNNRIVVDGGRVDVSSRLLVGMQGFGNQLTVKNGGQLRVASNSFDYVYQGYNSVIGWGGYSSNNTVTVTGSGSVWSNAFGIEVGYSGYDNQLSIQDGGQVLGGIRVCVGDGPGMTPSGNRILVGGTNSLLSATSLVVGTFTAWYNQIAVSNAARVVTGRSAIGDGTGSSFYNAGIVTGAGSVWSNASSFVVGFGGNGTGNRLTVADGGRVVNGTESFVSHEADTHDNSVLITGTGSTWNFGTNLYVGFGGSDSQLTVENGGTVVGQHGFLGYSKTAIGNSASVSGTGSVWSNGSALVVGYEGSNNVLTVADRALVAALELTVGSEATAQNNQLVINGGRLDVPTSLTLGQSGAGLLTLRGGSLASPLQTVGSSGSGAVTQTGGTNTVATSLVLAANPGSSGSYALLGGLLSAPDTVVEAGGTFTQGGGTFTGVLDNRGTFAYNGGVFNGQLVNEGVLDFNASFTAADGLLSYGELTLNTGVALTLNGSGYDNEGTLALAGGTLSGSGALANNGLLSGYGTIAGSGGFVNNATLIQGAGHLTLNNSGANVNDGSLLMALGYQLRLTGGALFNYGGIELNGATVTGASGLTNAASGMIWGFGTVSAPFSNDGALQVSGGTLNVSKPFTSSGLIDLGGAPANLTGGALLNLGTLQGAGTVGNRLVNGGTIEALEGTLTLGGAVTNRFDGLIAASAGSKVLVTAGLQANAGVINLTGGTFDNNRRALVSSGEVSGYGTFRAGSWRNTGDMVFGGGPVTVDGPLVNEAGGWVLAYGNTTLFTGAVTNNGTFKNTGASVIFADTYRENGSYVSDPADNFFTDLAVGPTGYLAGSTGDQFYVSGNLYNASTRNADWNTAAAKLLFQSGGSHTLELAAEDRGATAAGFVQNFAWGAVELGAGQSLTLRDGNGTAGGALYVGTFTLAGGTGQVSAVTGNGLHIYYNVRAAGNAYLQGKTYALANGGTLEPVGDGWAITTFARDPSGKMAVQFSFIPGLTYKISYSSNLVSWISIPGASLTFPSPGVCHWLDDGSLTGGLAPKRFYKLTVE